MNHLHEKLTKTSKWYASWHNQSNHQVVHWLVVVLVIFAVGGLFYFRSQTPKEDQSLSALNTQASNEDAKARLESQIPNLTKDLLNTAHRLKKASPDQKPAIINELVNLAQARKNLQKQALKDNPGAITRSAIPKGLKQQLLSDVAGLIEEEVTEEGTFEWLHGDDFEAEKSIDEYFILSKNNTRTKLNLTDGPKGNALTGAKIKVKGVKIDEEIAADSSSSANFQVTAGGEVAALSGGRKLAVILVNFPSDLSEPYTTDQARTDIFTGPSSANAKVQEMSYNTTSLTGKVRGDGDVYGWFTINPPSGTCDLPTIASRAQAAAQAQGFSASGYDHIMYAWRSASSVGCTASGYGYVGGVNSYVIGSSLSGRTPIHELGHNFGLYHSNFLLCSGTVIGSDCTSVDYGHRADTMGNLLGHFHPYQKQRINWLNSAGVPPITAVTTSGTYTIAPVSAPNSPIPRGLKIRKSSGVSYYVEFRRLIGLDGSLAMYYNSNLTQGIILTQNDDVYTKGKNNMLDLNPSTRSWEDAALAVNQTYTDSNAGVSITPLSVSDQGAQVQVTFGSSPPPTCTNNAPSLSITPSSRTGEAGSTQSYNFTMQNIDSNVCSSSTYNVTATLPSGWYMTPPSFPETLAPGASITRTFNITSTDTATGTNTVTLSARSTTNTSLSRTATTSFVISTVTPPPPTPQDTIPPTVSITSPKNGATLGSKGNQKVNVTASDASGILQIDILLDGESIKSCSNSTSCTGSINLRNLSSGSHIIQAKAKDNSPNQNEASYTITVTK